MTPTNRAEKAQGGQGGSIPGQEDAEPRGRLLTTGPSGQGQVIRAGLQEAKWGG